jgi:L-asparaginase
MSKKNPTINLIITGGTIDSYYEGSVDTVIVKKQSTIPKYIKNLKLYQKFKISKVCMKDSRDLTGQDIENIYTAVENSRYKKIIITHGTYTMPNTAKFLRKNLKNKDKVVIITGSMIPLEGFSPSDAAFNLGYSIAEAQNLPNGIYICMNGKAFSPEEVYIPQERIEFIKEGRFSSKSEKEIPTTADGLPFLSQ